MPPAALGTWLCRPQSCEPLIPQGWGQVLLGAVGTPCPLTGWCLAELRGYLSHGQPAPQYQIHLCFGEEYPTSTRSHFQKLIMAHVSTQWGWRWRHLCARCWGRHGLGDTRTCARPPSALSLHRWSQCLRGSSSITPSAWGRCCSETPLSPAPLVPPATSSVSSNSSASPEPSGRRENPVMMKPGSGVLCPAMAPLQL